MLFNKSNTGIDELKELTGFLYAYNNFSNISTDIELAQEDLTRVIGADVMELAETHYLSADYEQPTPEPEEPAEPEDPELPTPPGGGEPIPPGAGEDEESDPQPSNELLTALVKRIQLPLAYYAIHSFSQNADISHEDSGRKVKIDSEREKLPWEWMLEKDERAILTKAHRTTDRLIAFLDNNIDYLPAWKNGDARKAIKGQFFQSAEQFNAVYPIDSSRRFFLHIQPFIAEAERKHIAPVLANRYSEIKTALAAGTYDDTNNLLPLIRVPLALFAMSIAVDRLAIEVLPDGVYQNITSDRLTQQAKYPAIKEQKRELAAQILKDAQTELKYLQQALIKINDGEEDYTLPDLTSGLNENNQFARV